MKLTKKVLSLILAVIMVLSMASVVSAETVTHVISASGKTIIPAVEYASTNNSAGTRDYSTNGVVSKCIPINTSESVNLGSGSGLNSIYKINVEEAGQYRLTAWLSSTSSTVSADVCVMNGREVIARGISPVKTSSTTTSIAVETDLFNLSAGLQDFNLRIHAVNNNPYLYGDKYSFFFYFELEKVDEVKDIAYIYGDKPNTIEVENYVYEDKGITIDSNAVSISAGSTASFYADVGSAGNYAIAIRYETETMTNLKVNSLTNTVYDSVLIPGADYIIHTLGISTLNAGKNRIFIKPDQNIKIDKVYIKKVLDESSLETVNSATSVSEMKDAIKTVETALEISINSVLSEAINEIFYKEPIYNRLLDYEYASLDEFIDKYNDAIISEYRQPWVTLYVDDMKTQKITTGYVTLEATTGYIPKGSAMIAALYCDSGEFKTLENFDICDSVSQNTTEFILGDVEIYPTGTYELKFFYWDGLKNVTPIDVFDTVYEEIFVSNRGSDTTGDGTEENPYATIQRALEKVDEINDYQWGDIIVNVEGGIYTITETIVIDEKYSGKNGYNVIIRGEEDNQPIISGGIKVEKWEIDSGNIWKAPLSGVDYARNLYINGYPAVMARSDRMYDTAIKNDTSVPTTVHRVDTEDSANLYEISLKESTTGLESDMVKGWSGNAFTLSKEELGFEFANPVGLEFVWPYTFENHITPVTNFSKDDKNMTFSMNTSLLKRRESSVFKTGVSFYLQNAKELINKPGEFYYDKSAGYIYYYPYDYENMKTADVYVGNVEGMVNIAGSSNTSKVSNITFENLDFRYGAYNFISKYGYIGSQTDGVLVPFEWSEGNVGYKAQFEVNNADNVNIKGCQFACLGSAAIAMINSVSNSSVDGNIIRDISGTGIRIGAPTHNRERAGIDVCRNIDITNNIIRRIAGEAFNNCGITVYYEKFINILHNDIENVPYSGMSIGWGWGGGNAYDCSDIDVSYNKVQNVMNTLHDGGGIYTLGPLKNSKISNNYLKDHGSRSGGMIYNDQGSSLLVVHDNVILDAVLSQAITMANDVSSSTKDLTYYNNYSDVGTHPKIADGKGIDFEKHIIVTGEGENLSNPEAVKIYQNAGLESGYVSLLSKPCVELPVGGREISSTLPAPALSEVTSFSGADFDRDTSTQNLEMIPYADGIGTVLNSGEKVTYKLDIPEAGYYRIILRAAGNSSQYNGIKVSGDAQDVTMRVYQGSGGGISNQLAIANDGYRDYRICTARFEKGEQDITFTTASSGDSVIIKEVRYAPLLKNVKSSGVNVISLKNYYKVSGLNTNTFENSQSGYTSEGAKYHTTGAITNGGNKTTTLTYKLNVAEAGTYKVTAASWVGANSPITYQLLLDGEVKSEGTTKTYSHLTKSEDTVMTDITLPAGEVELEFKAKSNGPEYSIMYYFTLEKQN